MAPNAPLAAGTPHPKGNKTHEQVATFATMRDPAFELGVARAEFVNVAIRPDGSVDSNESNMIAAADAATGEALSGDPTDPATFERAALAARNAAEVREHIAARRFVMFVDVNGVPTTYLQANTPTNVDLYPPPAAPTDAPAPEGR